MGFRIRQIVILIHSPSDPITDPIETNFDIINSEEDDRLRLTTEGSLISTRLSLAPRALSTPHTPQDFVRLRLRGSAAHSTLSRVPLQLRARHRVSWKVNKKVGHARSERRSRMRSTRARRYPVDHRGQKSHPFPLRGTAIIGLDRVCHYLFAMHRGTHDGRI